ncbi:MAG: hypothetical protein M3R69_00945 [Acidobacteriota bacterium]|nr:hypothetical protein [Acidobacteriota bacterium]
MPELALPDDATNELKLADWLEIYALISADTNSSRGDLEQALRVASVLDSQGQEAVEQKCLEVFSEIELRQIAAGESYPFTIDGSVISVKPNVEEFVGYIFCLCLSYFRWSTSRNKEIAINPWLLFEELSGIAAAQFINGDVVGFGTSRGKSNAAKASFRANINDLAQKLGEGTGFKEQPILDRKDDKVDLVAWKDFQDKKRSKLVMFGQCAGGEFWTSKVSELQPDEFWGQWMIDSKVSHLIRSFYIPHRLESLEWDFYARKAGIFFDRCRIAYWAYKNNRQVTSDSRYREWFQHILKLESRKAKTSTKKSAKKSAKKK